MAFPQHTTSGWVNGCGKELFTLGWVQCDAITQGGGSPGGGYGAVILDPTLATDTQKRDNDAELVAMVIAAIESYYEY